MGKKLLNNILNDLIFKEWGTPKTVNVIGGMILGAAIGGLTMMKITPSKSIDIQNECEYDYDFNEKEIM